MAYTNTDFNIRPNLSKRNTYTKRMMSRIINIALLDMQFPFLLALLGKEQIAETMGGLIVTEIIGVFLVYCLKSFFETRESEEVRLREQQMQTESENLESEDFL